MVRTYRHGEVDGCQGKTRGLVDVPQERASFDSLLDHIVIFRARGIAESPFEKGIHGTATAAAWPVSLSREHNVSREMVYAGTVTDVAANWPLMAGP
jgi:hypothetical protein